MKIAISGKGGVGKTLLAALLSKVFAESGYSVLAIDADSNPSLAATLGFPQAEKIVPISQMKDLAEERTEAGAKKGTIYFKLNPRVDDLPEKYSQKLDGIRLMVMGQVKRGGSGCYCPENTLLQALITHLLLARNEVVIMDMEAGIEHLGRGTARAVDKLIIVVEPSRRSIDTAKRVEELARDINLKNVAFVGNKVRHEADRNFIISSLPGFQFLGFLPYDLAVVEADQATGRLLDASPRVTDEVRKIFQALLAGKATS